MSNNISLFLERYHGVDPHTLGATCVSWFWGSMLIGCVIGLLLLKLIDSMQLLKICCVLSAAVLAAGLFAPDSIRIAGYPVAVFALPAVGFAMSLMFPIIMSLALNSVSKHHGSFAGIMCSAIVGGAAGPLLVSMLSDAVSSQRIGMCLIFIFIAYILFIAFWAKPIVKNKLLTDKD